MARGVHIGRWERALPPTGASFAGSRLAASEMPRPQLRPRALSDRGAEAASRSRALHTNRSGGEYWSEHPVARAGGRVRKPRVVVLRSGLHRCVKSSVRETATSQITGAEHATYARPAQHVSFLRPYDPQRNGVLRAVRSSPGRP